MVLLRGVCLQELLLNNMSLNQSDFIREFQCGSCCFTLLSDLNVTKNLGKTSMRMLMISLKYSSNLQL